LLAVALAVLAVQRRRNSNPQWRFGEENPSAAPFRFGRGVAARAKAAGFQLEWE
jgi:hypothetical protein